MIDAPLLALAGPMIQREEGCRLAAYKDTRAIWTIGWGRADPLVREGMTCTQAQADEWFDTKLSGLCEQLDWVVSWWRNIDLPRQAVMLGMAYQLGVGGLLRFQKTLAAMQEGNWAVASAMMLMSDWQKQTPERAARMARIVKTGLMPTVAA